MNILLNYFLISWVLTAVIRDLDISDIPIWSIRRKSLKIVLIALHKVITCEKCISFWLTLIITKNFFMAAAVSFLIWVTWRVIGNIKTKL